MTDLTRPEADPDEGPEATPEQEARARALLAALPAPSMPQDVWARLEASLAAEAPLVAPPAPADAPPPVTAPEAPPTGMAAGAAVADLDVARERRASRSGRWLGAVAGIAAALVAVAVGIQVVGRPSSSDVAGSSAAASSAPLQDRLTPEVAAVPVVASGTTYQQASFADQAAAVVAAAAPAEDGSGSGGPGSPEPAATPDIGLKAAADTDTAGTFAATAEGVRDCAAALAGRTTVRVVVVDLATFAGRPVAVVVVARTDPTLDAWVVGRGCGADDTQVVAYRQVRLP